MSARTERRGPRALRITRRGVLAGAAAGGGLLVAWAAWPGAEPSPLTPGPNEHAFGAWLTIARDGVVTVAVPQLEMGQGAFTVLPQIVAQELGADWRLVAVQPAPPSGAFANVPLAAAWAPLWASAYRLADDPATWPDSWRIRRFARRATGSATAAGTMLAAFEDECRGAAATARTMLVEAAAARWDVPPERCRVADGRVSSGSRRLGFGALAAEAARLSPPDDPALLPRPAAEQPSAGRPATLSRPRLDLPSKATGSALFAADVRLPGMLFASIRHGPVGRPELAGFDAQGAVGVPGLRQVVRSRHWLAAAADSWWAAERALDAMRPRFSGTEPADGDAMARTLDAALRDVGETIAETGDGYSGEEPGLVATYRIAPQLHAAIETASATARVVGGRLELWMAAQSPGTALAAAAKAVGRDPADAVLYPVFAGGSFDSRLDHTHAIEAAVIADGVGRPVQLTWPRRQELLALPPRAPVHARLSAQYGAEGQRIARFHARYAAPSSMREFGHRVFDNMTPQSALEAASGQSDALALAGAVPPYAIQDVAVDHAPVTLPLPTGPLRGNGPAIAAFCTESFVDELAVRAGREPLSYRIAMLGHDPRLVACLLQVAGMAQWDGGRGERRQGLACARLDAPRGLGGVNAAGRIACIAETEGSGAATRVRRLYAAVDLGRIVNQDIAHQQLEGGLIFGVATALGTAARYVSGLPVTDRLGDLSIPMLATSPEIVVQFLHQPDQPPFDPGEIGAVVAPPAIANAVFAATGQRMRGLPFGGAAA